MKILLTGAASQLALAVNDGAPRAFAEALRTTSGRLLQVSTDFVFNGQQGSSYRPEQNREPLGAGAGSEQLSIDKTDAAPHQLVLLDQRQHLSRGGHAGSRQALEELLNFTGPANLSAWLAAHS